MKKDICNAEEMVVVSIARNRFSTKLSRKAFKWQDFVNIISKTKRTPESYETFMSLEPDDQTKIKDKGAYIGGFMINGDRKKSAVKYRSLITLDIDYADKDFWNKIKEKCDFHVVCYSTHKHSKEGPRVRVIIPMTRNVSVDEYEPIARKIAEIINLDYFDDTTFQVNRIMFWPTTSKNGDFFFDILNKPFLNPDNILSMYEDWQNITSWPGVSSSIQNKHFLASELVDPKRKLGPIGNFCKAFTIKEAIDKFLPHVYETTNYENRYTYLKGSTNGGLVIYENRYAYSFHATDPINIGHCFNAFDLVKTHLFGDLEEKESFAEMKKFVRSTLKESDKFDILTATCNGLMEYFSTIDKNING